MVAGTFLLEAGSQKAEEGYIKGSFKEVCRVTIRVLWSRGLNKCHKGLEFGFILLYTGH